MGNKQTAGNEINNLWSKKLCHPPWPCCTCLKFKECLDLKNYIHWFAKFTLNFCKLNRALAICVCVHDSEQLPSIPTLWFLMPWPGTANPSAALPWLPRQLCGRPVTTGARTLAALANERSVSRAKRKSKTVCHPHSFGDSSCYINTQPGWQRLRFVCRQWKSWTSEFQMSHSQCVSIQLALCCSEICIFIQVHPLNMHFGGERAVCYFARRRETRRSECESWTNRGSHLGVLSKVFVKRIEQGPSRLVPFSMPGKKIGRVGPKSCLQPEAEPAL